MDKPKSYSSFFRELFWPVYGEENWKFVPMLTMMTLALFVYTTLRIHKDTFILSAELSSANTLSFLKAYFVFPSSLLYMLFFYYINTKFSKKNVFLISIAPFFLFFFVFFMFCLPYSSSIHMSVNSIKYYQSCYPYIKNLIPAIAYWSFSLYYVFSELWGTVIITFLFWGMANYAVTPDESKRFYAYFASYSYVGLIFAAKIQSYLYSLSHQYQKGSQEYIKVLFMNFYFVIVPIILFVLLHLFLHQKVLKIEDEDSKEKVFIKKSKPSFSSGLKIILQSKYLGYIALLVIAYGLTSNLLEITWKELVRQELKGVESAIGIYMSDFYFTTGVCTICLGLVNKYIINNFGWKVSSLFMPIFLLLSSFCFFSLVVFHSCFAAFFAVSGYSMALHIGFIQDIMAKGCKYGMFDPNIQMVYIPLEDDLKIKGKAAIDIVGARAGKSFASILESNLSVLFKGADQIALSPIFMPIVLFSCAVWVWATNNLADEYSKLTKK